MPRVQPFLVAAAQVAPEFLDAAATTRKACATIREAAAKGARLIVFPEAFIPGYPLWVWYVPAGDSASLREAYAELVAESVAIPGPEISLLSETARECGVCVAIGVNERNAEASNSSIYNTLVWIGSDGQLLGRHRKLVPTSGERLVHASGDGSTLGVYETPLGRVGGLICWENYMPLARYAMYVWGEQIHAAPTWDRGEPWLSTLRHVAKEGRMYVIGAGSPMRKDDVPDRLALKERYLAGAGDWLNPGGSAIVDPDGKVIAGPAHEEETILYAEVDPRKISGPRSQLDVAGHYARPDIFELTVHRQPRSMLHVDESPEGGEPVEG